MLERASLGRKELALVDLRRALSFAAASPRRWRSFDGDSWSGVRALHAQELGEHFGIAKLEFLCCLGFSPFCPHHRAISDEVVPCRRWDLVLVVNAGKLAALSCVRWCW